MQSEISIAIQIWNASYLPLSKTSEHLVKTVKKETKTSKKENKNKQTKKWGNDKQIPHPLTSLSTKEHKIMYISFVWYFTLH